MNLTKPGIHNKSQQNVSEEIQPNASKEIRKKMAWFEYYEECGKNARQTCRHFHISPDTFYRWKKRYNPNNLLSLVDDKKTRRPKNLRQPTTPPQVITRIKELKKQYPSWSGNKISLQLNNEGVSITATTVTRTINRLKSSGILHDEPVSRINNRRKGITNRCDNKQPTGYQEYLSLLNLWKE